MEIAGGGAKLLLRDPLAAQAFILRLNRLDFIRIRLLPGLLVISRFRDFQKIGSRMPHTVGFAVMVQPFRAVSSTPRLIRCNLPRDMACLGLWGHTVYIDLPRLTVRAPFLIVIVVDLTGVKVLPYIEHSSLQRLVGFRVVLFHL